MRGSAVEGEGDAGGAFGVGLRVVGVDGGGRCDGLRGLGGRVGGFGHAGEAVEGFHDVLHFLSLRRVEMRCCLGGGFAGVVCVLWYLYSAIVL